MYIRNYLNEALKEKSTLTNLYSVSRQTGMIISPYREAREICIHCRLLQIKTCNLSPFDKQGP